MNHLMLFVSCLSVASCDSCFGVTCTSSQTQMGGFDDDDVAPWCCRGQVPEDLDEPCYGVMCVEDTDDGFEGGDHGCCNVCSKSLERTPNNPSTNLRQNVYPQKAVGKLQLIYQPI